MCPPPEALEKVGPITLDSTHIHACILIDGIINLAHDAVMYLLAHCGSISFVRHCAVRKCNDIVRAKTRDKNTLCASYYS